ncbi:hypothetical protein E5083_24200 [Streptomyces bauhiniae]|uniref:Uncharacterized protein n=1 Tax=Streptomyces bauhiniae TaxID=2340725 RepID=A0A4Z1CXS5_9ACTN|nr:hypothetical protein [Streptomyces bauhiniae]TGN73894.1 hypothetical protein E5083_24200 [Streptomyces bauhiniae]
MAVGPLIALIVPLWLMASGVFCFLIGRNSGSARLGWLFFLLLGPLSLGAMLAFTGAIAAAITAGVVAGLLLFLLILDRYGDDPDEPDADHFTG